MEETVKQYIPNTKRHKKEGDGKPNSNNTNKAQYGARRNYCLLPSPPTLHTLPPAQSRGNFTTLTLELLSPPLKIFSSIWSSFKQNWHPGKITG